MCLLLFRGGSSFVSTRHKKDEEEARHSESCHFDMALDEPPSPYLS